MCATTCYRDKRGGRITITRINPDYLPKDATTSSGSDLNSQPVGSVWWGNNFTNAPSNGWYQVVRIGHLQTATMYVSDTKPPILYYRSYINGVWQPWSPVSPEAVKISSQNHVSDAEMGNSGLSDGCWYLKAVDPKTAHQYSLIPRLSGLMLWDSSDSREQWNIDTGKLSTSKGTLTSSVGTFGSGYKWCRRYGNIVQFYAAITLTSATTRWSTAILNIPAGFRPSDYTLMTFSLGSQGSVKGTYLGAVDTGGNLAMDANFASGSYLQISGMYIV